MPSLRCSVDGMAGPAPTSSEAPPGAWPPDASRLLLATLLALFGLVVVRTAWLSDDAFITLRTVDILVNGYGPRWNVAERVQAYTHPLWMMTLALPCAVTREQYVTTLLLSLSCAFAASNRDATRSPTRRWRCASTVWRRSRAGRSGQRWREIGSLNGIW
jgi:hypothetical protein